MKIIFDSEEEKDDLIRMCCPGDLSRAESYAFCGPDSSCKDCWERCGIAMEVRG